MNIEVGAIILMLISVILSSYSGYISYQRKAKDADLQEVKASCSDQKTSIAVLDRRVQELEDNQITPEGLEAILKKAINSEVRPMFLEFEIKLLKDSNKKKAKHEQ